MQDDRQKFIDWLDGHGHEEIKNLTVAGGDLSREVSDLLRQAKIEKALDAKTICDIRFSIG